MRLTITLDLHPGEAPDPQVHIEGVGQMPSMTTCPATYVADDGSWQVTCELSDEHAGFHLAHLPGGSLHIDGIGVPAAAAVTWGVTA